MMVTRIHIGLVLWLSVVHLVLLGQSEIVSLLNNINEIEVFTALESPEGYESAFEIFIKQPIDHQDHMKGFFLQKMYLSHRSLDAPVCMITQGYHRPGLAKFELADVIRGNQLDIEHRYFGQSLPSGIGYKYLTLEQACADLHRINSIFKRIYQQDWISTGVSKGGQTTMVYRYLYPKDVVGSVPYVAPLNLSLNEERIYEWLDKSGNAECRDKIYEFQVSVLKNRDGILNRLKWYSIGAGLTYEYHPLKEAFEYQVLEYPFSFFQWGKQCEDIPPVNSNVDILTSHLIQVSGIDFFSDAAIDFYAPHYYQAASQMGYYGYEVAPFQELLRVLPSDQDASAIFVPKHVDGITYDNSLMTKVRDWIIKEAKNFIFIYGEGDTWSATAVPESKIKNSVWIIMSKKHHGNARIKYMTDKEKERVAGTLSSWLNRDIVID